MIYEYFPKFFFGLFFGLIYAIALYRSWKVEHGDTRLEQERNDTLIWIDPMMFPLLVVLWVMLMTWNSGQEAWYLRAGLLLLSMLLDFSTYFIILLILMPVLRKYFMARTCAILWILPVILYFYPQIWKPSMTTNNFVLYIKSSWMLVGMVIWFIGFSLVLGVQIFSHLQFCKKLEASAEMVKDPAIYRLWAAEKKRLRMDQPDHIPLRYSSFINSPVSIGLLDRNQATYLPVRSFTEEELHMIFSHELHHLQRRDTHTKFCLSFFKAMGWFHPLVWLAVKKAGEDLELSCDEIVLEEADETTRKQYAELLLRTAGEPRGYSTCLSATAKTLRHRLRATMHVEKKRLGMVLVMVIMCGYMLGCGHLTIASGGGTIETVVLQELFEAEDLQSVLYVGDDEPDKLEMTAEERMSYHEYFLNQEVDQIVYKPNPYVQYYRNYMQLTYNNENYKASIHIERNVMKVSLKNKTTGDDTFDTYRLHIKTPKDLWVHTLV